MSFRIEPLGSEHDLEDFSCGAASLDDWLQRHAHSSTGHGTRTYVLVDDATRDVAGYFAIAPHLAERQNLPRSIGRGAPERIPAILLAKLALDARFHETGLGSELLAAAITIIVSAARAAGGRLIVVDAIDDNAAAFYRHHNFTSAPDDPLRLVMKLSSAARTLGQPWP